MPTRPVPAPRAAGTVRWSADDATVVRVFDRIWGFAAAAMRSRILWMHILDYAYIIKILG
jgi:hypothetical protein